MHYFSYVTWQSESRAEDTKHEYRTWLWRVSCLKLTVVYTTSTPHSWQWLGVAAPHCVPRMNTRTRRSPGLLWIANGREWRELDWADLVTFELGGSVARIGMTIRTDGNWKRTEMHGHFFPSCNRIFLFRQQKGTRLCNSGNTRHRRIKKE